MSPRRPGIAPRRSLIAVLALIAFVIGQSMATAHTLKHLVSGDDSQGTPSQHYQLCLDCVSFAPIASANGGTAQPLFIAAPATEFFSPVAAEVLAETGLVVAFRSRAPPLLHDA